MRLRSGGSTRIIQLDHSLDLFDFAQTCESVKARRAVTPRHHPYL